MQQVEKNEKLQSVIPKVASMISLSSFAFSHILVGDFNAEATDSWYAHLSKFGIIDGYKSIFFYSVFYYLTLT